MWGSSKGNRRVHDEANQASYKHTELQVSGNYSEVQPKRIMIHEPTFSDGNEATYDIVCQRCFRINKPGIMNSFATKNTSVAVPYRSAKALPRLLVYQDYEKQIGLIRALVSLLSSAGITVVMGYGTLVGSWMFHGLIPWDDDADLMIPYSDIPKLKRLFGRAETLKNFSITSATRFNRFNSEEYSYEVLKQYVSNNAHYNRPIAWIIKVFTKNGKRTNVPIWTWPFVDITFYRENRTHVWFHHPKKPRMVFLRHEFYPLYRRPFADMWLYAPKETGLLLRRNYGNFTCTTSDLSHMEERHYEPKTSDCKKLWSVYPHADSSQRNGFPVETLYIDNVKLSEFVLPVKVASMSNRPRGF